MQVLDFPLWKVWGGLGSSLTVDRIFSVNSQTRFVEQEIGDWGIMLIDDRVIMPAQRYAVEP